MVEVMKIMVTSFKKSCACIASLSAPSNRPSLTHASTRAPGHSWQVWVSLLWGYWSFLLGPVAHKFLFVTSKSLFPQSYVSFGGPMVGLMATSSKRDCAVPRSAAPRVPDAAAGHC